MVKMGGSTSIGASGVTFRGTSRVTSRGASAAATPCKERGIGIRFGNIAGASYLEG
jgi:hypothetical protein